MAFPETKREKEAAIAWPSCFLRIIPSYRNQAASHMPPRTVDRTSLADLIILSCRFSRSAVRVSENRWIDCGGASVPKSDKFACTRTCNFNGPESFIPTAARATQVTRLFPVMQTEGKQRRFGGWFDPVTIFEICISLGGILESCSTGDRTISKERAI